MICFSSIIGNHKPQQWMDSILLISILLMLKALSRYLRGDIALMSFLIWKRGGEGERKGDGERCTLMHCTKENAYLIGHLAGLANDLIGRKWIISALWKLPLVQLEWETGKKLFSGLYWISYFPLASNIFCFQPYWFWIRIVSCFAPATFRCIMILPSLSLS